MRYWVFFVSICLCTYKVVFKMLLSQVYYAFPLDIQHKLDLASSLRSLVEGEVLDGDNKFLCEQCEKKVFFFF
jgi:hypothetical protein